MPRPVRAACWFLLLMTAGGCADGVGVDAATQQPVYVTGRVRYRGYPVAYGQIVFAADPDFGAGTGMSVAALAHDGTFVLQDGQQLGLKPGYYRITISNHTQSGYQLPHRYYDPQTSGLRCQVEAGQPLKLNIELE